MQTRHNQTRDFLNLKCFRFEFLSITNLMCSFQLRMGLPMVFEPRGDFGTPRRQTVVTVSPIYKLLYGGCILRFLSYTSYCMVDAVTLKNYKKSNL
jgi:hypothetical protein